METPASNCSIMVAEQVQELLQVTKELSRQVDSVQASQGTFELTVSSQNKKINKIDDQVKDLDAQGSGLIDTLTGKFAKIETSWEMQLGQLKNDIQKELMGAKNEFDKVQNEISKTQRVVEGMYADMQSRTQSQGIGNRNGLVSDKLLQPEIFDGVVKNWDKWSRDFSDYLDELFDGFQQLLQSCASSKVVID